MQSETFIPIDDLLLKTIEDRVKEAVEAKWIETFPSKEKTNARQDAITLLYWYPSVKHLLLDRQDEEKAILDYFKDVESQPKEKRERMEKSKTYAAMWDKLDAIQADILKLGGYVRDVDKALDKIKDEPYYHLVYDRYILEMTDWEIVEKHQLKDRFILDNINETLDVIKFYLSPMKALREAVTTTKFNVKSEIRPKRPVGRPRKN